jgi:hypothetical protein
MIRSRTRSRGGEERDEAEDMGTQEQRLFRQVRSVCVSLLKRRHEAEATSRLRDKLPGVDAVVDWLEVVPSLVFYRPQPPPKLLTSCHGSSQRGTRARPKWLTRWHVGPWPSAPAPAAVSPVRPAVPRARPSGMVR